MAFSVTPTSGAAPYTFTASIDERLGFELGLYVTEFSSVGEVGSCPSDEVLGTNSPTAALSLLNTGEYILSGDISANNCRRFIYLVRRLSDNEIVSKQSVVVNNVV